MPYPILKPCTGGCGKLIVPPSTICPACQQRRRRLVYL